MENTDKIIFVSGHINLTKTEFCEHYKPKLDKLIETKKNKIVVGNAAGADTIALNYLLENGYPPNMITIYYHRFDKNHLFRENEYKSKNLNVINGFKSFEERDSAMTFNSDEDLLWIRPMEETRKIIEASGIKFRPERISGTEKNFIRRQQKDKLINNTKN